VPAKAPKPAEAAEVPAKAPKPAEAAEVPAKDAKAPKPAEAAEVPAKDAKAPKPAEAFAPAPVAEADPEVNENTSSVTTGNPASVRTTRSKKSVSIASVGKNKEGHNLALQNIVIARPVSRRTRKRTNIRSKLIGKRTDKTGKDYFTVRKLKQGSNTNYDRSRPFDITQPYIQKVAVENLENEA
jgi:hypothetical protein